MKEIDRQKNILDVFACNRIDLTISRNLYIKPVIIKKNEVRAPTPLDERLAIALRFLASGESQTASSYYFKIGKATVCGIVREVCEAK